MTVTVRGAGWSGWFGKILSNGNASSDYRDISISYASSRRSRLSSDCNLLSEYSGDREASHSDAENCDLLCGWYAGAFGKDVVVGALDTAEQCVIDGDED